MPTDRRDPQRPVATAPARRASLVLLLTAASATVLAASSPATQAVTPKAVIAAPPCDAFSVGGPCLGPIQSFYDYEGGGEGDIKLLRAKAGPIEKDGTAYKTLPSPGYYEKTKRRFAWHSVASIEIVNVYIVHFKGKRASYTKLPSGRHSGQTTLTETQASASPPLLLLQGQHLPAVQSADNRGKLSISLPPKARIAKAHCQFASEGGPCAPIMSIYNYWSYSEGDLKLINLKRSPNKIVGHVHKTWPTPGEYEVNERTLTWHSVPSVEIIGVYILREVGKGFSYKKLPTGKHSGHTKLTAVTSGSTPSLVLQGRRT
jgi:hypothetical protein